MTDHTNTYPDLVNVEDWLNAKGYTGEAGACHQAMSLIRKQEKRIEELEEALDALLSMCNGVATNNVFHKSRATLLKRLS